MRLSFESRRLLAFGVDSLIIGLLLWLANGAKSSALLTNALALVAILKGQALFLDWHFVLSLATIPSAVLLIAYLCLSSSPGLFLFNLRYAHQSPLRAMDPKTSLIKALAAVPSLIPLFGMGYVLSLGRSDRRSPLDQALKLSWYKLPKLASSPLRRAGSYAAATLIFVLSAKLTVVLLFHSNLSPEGIYLGGSRSERATLRAKFLHPPPQRASSQSAQACFEALRLALRNQDKELALSLLTPASQVYAHLRLDQDSFFTWLPEDIQALHKEQLSDDQVKIYYAELENNQLGSFQGSLVFTKRAGEWKLDLLAH